ncbi:MAG: class I tRNA ligase family protein, partial [Patescibacteria group bacterium]
MVSLFNTLTRKKEPFEPLKEGSVSMYHCGPTAYDRAHIGNLRSFITWDILRRVFELQGFKVKQVMNITDVDDKTIGRARKEGVSLKELTSRYAALFLDDISALNILSPHTLSLATEHIEEMIVLIGKLLDRGYAYKTDDNSVYFKVSASKDYGKLACLNAQAVRYGAPSPRDEYGKEDVRDFALWKAWVPEDGDVFWETKLGKGRPGWHIECSAMSMKYLGEEFDIHTG